MIVGSLLLPSIGGGVCQTATTLFNNAFELGLPIVRRHNHSFYISHYPLGRDATVSWGGPDLVFKNDLEHALLIKSSYTSSTLTFTFFGTPTGRRVVVDDEPADELARARDELRVRPVRGRPARFARRAARTRAASTSRSTARCTSAGRCCARTRSRAATSRSARRSSTARGRTRRGSTSRCRRPSSVVPPPRYDPASGSRP